eukprot:12625263-Heterocapsa_arctica.AAC.1
MTSSSHAPELSYRARHQHDKNGRDAESNIATSGNRGVGSNRSPFSRPRFGNELTSALPRALRPLF